jgi:hypothetical protein
MILIDKIILELIITDKTSVENHSDYDITSGVAWVCVHYVMSPVKDYGHAVSNTADRKHK